ncbi:MAG: Dabb family protein [Clostridia bacterium]|nr:Dabb family protein [Clostridia bacterium]
MIKHIVCFKLKNGESVDKAVEVLSSMKGNVKTIIDMEVGKDFLHSERSYDIILQVKLKDKLALEEYQNDPYHCSVVKTHMHKVRESSIAIDYEV